MATFNPNTYEHPYGFELLDTVHNFYPEVLYDEVLFPQPMFAWFRHRTAALFSQQYAYNESVYRIYQAHTRRSQMDIWRALQSYAAPPTATISQLTPRTTVRRRASPQAAETVQAPTTNRSTTPIVPVPNPAPPRPYIQRQQTTSTPVMPVTLTYGIRSSSGLSGLSGLSDLDALSRISLETLGSAAGLWDFLNLATMTPNAQQDSTVPTEQEINAGSTVFESTAIPEDTECAICQEQSDGQWRKLHCGHYFHKTCVDTWFGRNTHCPVCRADIRRPPASTPTSAPGPAPAAATAPAPAPPSS